MAGVVVHGDELDAAKPARHEALQALAPKRLGLAPCGGEVEDAAMARALTGPSQTLGLTDYSRMVALPQ